MAQFLRVRAWWRLDSAGASALHVARSVVSARRGRVRIGPPRRRSRYHGAGRCGLLHGRHLRSRPEGWTIVREWQLADQASAGPEDLLAQLAHAAARDGPGAHLARLASLAQPDQPGLLSAPAAISVPRQVSPATEPAQNR